MRKCRFWHDWKLVTWEVWPAGLYREWKCEKCGKIKTSLIPKN